MRQVYEAVRKHVSERRGEMISLLEKIVNIDSGTTNIAGVEAVCGILKQEMEAIGMDVRVIPSEGAGPGAGGGVVLRRRETAASVPGPHGHGF